MADLKARVDEAYKEQLDDILHDRKISMQDAIVEAIGLWVEKGGGVAPKMAPRFADLDAREERILQRVLDVLRSKSKRTGEYRELLLGALNLAAKAAKVE